MSPKIGIVIPVYNGAKTLAATLASAMDQEVRAELTLFVVDDGSSDCSVQLVREFAAGRANVHCETQPNGGVARARNRGLALAGGCDFVMFLDQDDVLRPGALALLLDRLQADAAVGMVYGQVVRIDDDGVQIDETPHRSFRYRRAGLGLQKVAGNSGALTSRYLYLDNCIKSPGQALLRLPVLTGARLSFDPDLPGVDDWDLWFHLSQVTSIVGVPEVTLQYRVHLSNASHNIRKMRWLGLQMRLKWLRQGSVRRAPRILGGYALRLRRAL